MREETMTMKGSYDRTLPDVTEWLCYDPALMDPAKPTGLWFCADAVDVQAVGVNAMCLPAAGSWNDLDRCEGFISRFEYVVVVAAGRDKRAELVRELTPRIGYMCIYTAQDAGFRGCRSVRELLDTCGFKAVERLIVDVEEVPTYGLLDLAKVEEPDIWKLPRTLSGIKELDRAIGGFFPGELSVWTGKRGGGKSTLLGQLLLQAIDQGHKVCAYSGELPAWRFKNWTMLQAAGPENIQAKMDEQTGKTIYTVNELIRTRIDQWWAGQFWLYDLNVGGAHDEDSIIRLFETAVRRFGCDTFLVDNLMTAHFKGTKDADFYRAQSNFTGRLVQFAKKHGVHVHLVAHPRKTQNKSLDADDVGGSGDVTNRADNAFSVRRLSEDDAEKKGYTTVLEVLKNRAYGNQAKLALEFDEGSRRFYKSGGGAPGWRFNWAFDGEQQFIEVPAQEGDPFPEVADGTNDD